MSTMPARRGAWAVLASVDGLAELEAMRPPLVAVILPEPTAMAAAADGGYERMSLRSKRSTAVAARTAKVTSAYDAPIAMSSHAIC